MAQHKLARRDHRRAGVAVDLQALTSPLRFCEAANAWLGHTVLEPEGLDPPHEAFAPLP
jgi:hypothetical protein